MLEKRRKEIIDMILEEALVLSEFVNHDEVYNAAYSGIDKIKETYSFDELEALYIETFSKFEELRLREAKKKYTKKVTELVEELREYPNIDIDMLEEYNYRAISTIDDCIYQKDIIHIYLHYLTMFDNLKVTDLHKHFLDLIDEIVSSYDSSNPGVVLSVNLAKNAILNTNKVSDMNNIIEEFKSSVGKKFTTIDEVREYYKKQLLEYSKTRMNISNATSIMMILDETFKVIDSFNDSNELEVLYGQVTLLIDGYVEPNMNNEVKRKK